VSALEILIDAALQDPAAAARRAKASGQRVIGFVGTDIPVELIAAAGAFPWRLPAAAESPTARADAYLEASFQPQERAIAEQWLAGGFDFVDEVVFTRANDSIQRLYYYLCELRRRKLCDGPAPLLFDLCKIPRNSSARRTQAVTVSLSEALGSRINELPQCYSCNSAACCAPRPRVRSSNGSPARPTAARRANSMRHWPSGSRNPRAARPDPG
jgi:hypothetical protein